MKKHFQSNFVKELNEKSDAELIDELYKCSNDRSIAVIEALLNQRLKRSLQFLTEVIQENNRKTTKYNWVLIFLTIIITLAIIANIIAFYPLPLTN